MVFLSGCLCEDSSVTRYVCPDGRIFEDPLNCSNFIPQDCDDDCLTNKAITLKDAYICDRVVDLRSRDQCYLDYTVKYQRYDLCSKMIYESFQEDCYYKIAVLSGIDSVCDKAGRMSDDCFRDLAIQKGRPDLCEGIPEYDEYDKILCEAVSRKKVDECTRLSCLGIWRYTRCPSMIAKPEENESDSILQPTFKDMSDCLDYAKTVPCKNTEDLEYLNCLRDFVERLNLTVNVTENSTCNSFDCRYEGGMCIQKVCVQTSTISL
ncbi:MAG: hypothetical protein ABH851_01480 [Methanobacteriota archaeon]